MAKAVLWSLASEVAEWLNGEEFSLPFVAARKLRPKATLEQLDSLAVTVVPRGSGRSLVTRGYHQVEPMVDVGLQQSFAPGDDDLVEDLVALGEELSAAMLGQALTVGDEKFGCVSAEFVVFDPDAIETLGVFTGVVTATFRGTQPR